MKVTRRRRIRKVILRSPERNCMSTIPTTTSTTSRMQPRTCLFHLLLLSFCFDLIFLFRGQESSLGLPVQSPLQLRQRSP